MRASATMPPPEELHQRGPLYSLWPTQQKAMELVGLTQEWATKLDAVNELLYGGQAGGGKSYFLRAAATTMCFIWPGSVHPIFRRTYGELEESHIRAIQEEIPPEVGRYYADRHELRFHNGSIIAFRFCDREHDVFRYQSAEWQSLSIDEATHLTKMQIEYLKTRVRAPLERFPGWRRIILYASNPGNVGHAYFKQGFVDAGRAGVPFDITTSYGTKKLVTKRCYLPAKLIDNPALDHDAYVITLLENSDELTRKALMDGDWSIFAGRFFTEWDERLHVIPSFKPPANWTKWVAIDYGFAAPFCALWFARSPDRKRVVVYRELYQKGLYDFQQAKLVRSMSKGERIRLFVADTQMFNERREAGLPSIARIFSKNHIPLVRASKSRQAGWALVKRNLYWNANDKVPPRLFVTRDCPNLIRTIPLMVRDEKNPEDLADTVNGSKTEDDACDTLRYGLMAEGNAYRKMLLQRYRISF